MLEKILGYVEELKATVESTEKRGNDYTVMGGAVIDHLEAIKKDAQKLMKNGHDYPTVTRMRHNIFTVECFDYGTSHITKALDAYVREEESKHYCVTKTVVTGNSRVGRTVVVSKHNDAGSALLSMTKEAKKDVKAYWSVVDNRLKTAEAVIYTMTFNAEGRAFLDY